MSAYGLMESMKREFGVQLRVFKGGNSGNAELRRVVVSGTTRTWPAAVPPEIVTVHWEALDAEGADALGIDLSGTTGRRFWFDTILETPLVPGDRVIVDDVVYTVERGSEPGNNSPNDSVAAVRRG